MRAFFLLATVLCCCYLHTFAQDVNEATATAESKGVVSISQKSLSFIQSKYSKLTRSVEQQSNKMLNRMQRKEQKLRHKLQRKDSTLAKELFDNRENKYKALQSSLSSQADTSLTHPLQEYIPNLDSLQTALAFLKQGNALQELSPDKLKQIGEVQGQLKELQARMQQANDIQAYIRQRQQELKQQIKDKLLNSSIARSFKSINKEAFYYEQRLREYKELIGDNQKLEQKALELVRNLPAFQSFWQKHSYLAQLFPTPAGFNTEQMIAGLQTMASVQGLLTQRISVGGGGSNPQAYLQQQMQSAQSQLSQLKDKINKLGGGSSDMTMPDFKPNNQKTKTFLQRLEYGLTIQSQKGTNFLPGTSDIGATLGYRFSDKKTIGVGIAYIVGLGKSWQNIHLSSEGVSFRSYTDIKAKGSFWVTGGYELNYMQGFRKFEELRNVSLWQKSALAGLTKKYKVGKKEGKFQLLYDFLHKYQIPQSEGFQFRIGYSF